MNAVTHLEKVIVGEVSAVTHLEKVIAGETSAVTYTEKVITGEAPPITHLQRVIAGVESPVTHLEYVWAGGSPTPTEHEYTGAVPYTFRADGSPLISWRISGNTVQNGTPTPDSPIMPQGTGERTGNLFDESTIEVGGLDINTGAEVANSSRRRSGFIKVTPSTTYTLSRVIDATKSNFWVIGYDANKNVISDSAGTLPTVLTSIGANSTVSVFDTTTSTEYIRWYVTANGSYSDIMLNTGSTALPYEPYGYKIPISSASTTTPVYLGEVETTRRVKKLVMTGEETISGGIEYNRFYFTIQDMRSEGVRLTKLFCTHYQNNSDGRPIANVPDNSIYTGGGTDSQRVFIKTTDYTTVTDFKAYLQQQYAAGTPVTVWYVLATEETGIVNEPLMKIGDYADEVSNVATIPTNNGSTTIDVETTVKPSEVYIKYKGV